MSFLKRIIKSGVNTVVNFTKNAVTNFKGLALMTAATAGISAWMVSYGLTALTALSASAVVVILLSR